jgi:serine protease Do
MPPLVRRIRKCYAQARLGLLRSSCLLPFAAAAGTPLEAVLANYLAIVNGVGVFGGTGSALILHPGLAVTSAHVVEGRGRVTAFGLGGPVELGVRAISDRIDLAVLDAPEALGGELTLRAALPGEPVWAMGATSGGLAPTAAGCIEVAAAQACLEAQVDEGPFQTGLMYAADAGPGYSGGPVVDGAGAVVGLTEGIYTRLFGEAPLSWPAVPRMFAYHAGTVLAEARRLISF